MLRYFLLLGSIFVCIALIANYGPSLWESDEKDAAHQQIVAEKESTEEVQDVPEQSKDAHESGEEGKLESEIEVTEIPPLKEEEKIIEVTNVIEKGDTFAEILGKYADNNEVYAYINAMKKVFSAGDFILGQPYLVKYNTETESIIRFEYETKNHKKLVIEGSPPTATLEDIIFDKKLTFVESEITDNLFNAVTNLGETAGLAFRIADLFAWEINFIRDIQPGDSFSILVEKLYREGEFKAYGRAIGSTFTNKDKTYEAFLFYDSSGKDGYYNLKGESLKKVLLQSPLSFTRVTSGYTRSRKHPIFGDYRPHLGIDYGAPTGTPIMAVGAGTVTVKGWVGGFGNHIKIKHSSGFESMYSHMSRYARNIKKGSKVKQGQIIAYVGSTGNSTGPHLDFRLKLNGKYINPSKAMSPRSESISKKNKAAFEKRVAIIREYMQKKRDITQYDPESMNPPKK